MIVVRFFIYAVLSAPFFYRKYRFRSVRLPVFPLIPFYIAFYFCDNGCFCFPHFNSSVSFSMLPERVSWLLINALVFSLRRLSAIIHQLLRVG